LRKGYRCIFILFYFFIGVYIYPYTFSSITIENDFFPPMEVRSLLSSSENKELNEEDIVNLSRKLTNLYIKNGYITSFVKLKSINSEDNELVFSVEYGRINDILIEDSYDFSLPTSKGEILNIRDIDQFIENTKTELTNMKVEILPSEREGYSDIEIKKERKKQFRARVILDNFNYKDQGRENVALFFYRDSSVFLGDSFQFFIKERLSKNRDDNKESQYRLTYSVPIGYSALQYSFTKKKNFDRFPNKKYSTKKDEDIHYFEFSRVLSRNSENKFEIYSSLNLKDTKNYFNDIKLDVSSKRYSSFTVGLRNTHYFNNSHLFIDLGLEKGVSWFHSDNNNGNEKILNPFD